MLDRVCILSCERDGCRETVVELVDGSIEVWAMEEAMGVVEEHLPKESAEDNIADEL